MFNNKKELNFLDFKNAFLSFCNISKNEIKNLELSSTMNLSAITKVKDNSFKQQIITKNQEKLSLRTHINYGKLFYFKSVTFNYLIFLIIYFFKLFIFNI